MSIFEASMVLINSVQTWRQHQPLVRRSRNVRRWRLRRRECDWCRCPVVNVINIRKKTFTGFLAVFLFFVFFRFPRELKKFSCHNVLDGSSRVSALVEWLEFLTPVREGPGSKPARVKL